MAIAGYTDFGGGPNDVVQDAAGNYLAGQQFTVWTTQIGGSQITNTKDADGTDNGGIVASGSGAALGRIQFQAPDSYSLVWLDRGDGSDRWGILSLDYLGKVSQAVIDAAAALIAATSATSAVAGATAAAETAEARSIEALDAAHDAAAVAEALRVEIESGNVQSDLTDRLVSMDGAGALVGPPVVGSSVVQMPIVDQYNAFPGLAKTKNGTLIVVWRTGPSHGGGTNGRLYLSRSYDGGATWSTPELIRDETLDCRDPYITISKDGSRWYVTYFTYTSSTVFRSYVLWSDDEGATWQDPVSLSVNTPRAVCSPMVELADGTLMATLYGDNGSGDDIATVVTSTDKGETWSTEVTAAAGSGIDYQEPAIVDTPSGVVMLVRYNNHDGIARLIRTGTTWSAPVRKFTGWGAPRFCRLSTGRLIVIYRHDTTSAAMWRYSDDNGVNWSPEKLFDNNTTQMVYAAPLEIRPGLIAVPCAFDIAVATAVLRMRYMLNGSGSSPIGDSVPSAGSRLFMESQVLAADSFNRPNASTVGTPDIGPAWSTNSSGFGIIDGAAEPTATGPVYAGINLGGIKDYEIECDVTWIANSGPALFFRYTNPTNFLMLTSETAGANFRLYKVVGGTATQLATASAVQAKTFDGVTMRWGVSAKGNRINCYLDGALILAHDLTGDANLASLQGNAVGVRANHVSGSHHHRFSRFLVRGVA